MSQYLTVLNMRVSTCSCGLTWAAPEQWFKEREKDHKTFQCPNGCRRYFPKENEEERLGRLLTQERKCCISAREEANVLERQCRAYKGHMTRLKQKEKTGD